MTQQLKSYAYKLKQDLEHLELIDWDYDLELNPVQIEHIQSLGSGAYDIEPLDIPDPLDFAAEMSSLIFFDYPYADYLNGSIMSKRMLDVLSSVKPFAYRTYPIKVTDWELTPPREFEVPKNYDYVFVQLTEYADIFDYEKSVYTKHPYKTPRYDQNGQEEWFVSNVKEFAFHTPKDGFPSIFRIKESPVSLFISDEARQALKEAKISGIEYESLKGLAYGETRTETDVTVDFPKNFDDREPALREKVGA